MQHPRLYLLAIGVSVLLASLHLLAMKFYLYWNLPWLDLVMHTLGGFMLGLPAYLLAAQRLSPRTSLFVALGAALFVGTVWEIFEYIEGLSQDAASLVLDTIGDYAADTLGSLAAALLARAAMRKP